ncbi:hypothetical protein [Microbacterium sp. NPDC064584]|uniref:hypothetical protein n=1 Tax=Microbacterium sp. NPDC064584 TaxID=3155817 RepID=UPI00341C404E
MSIVDDPDAASRMLLDLGVARERANGVVAHYASNARRVLVDTKHTQERLILEIQQQLESELIDELPNVYSAELGALFRQLAPDSPFAASSATRSLAAGHGGSTPVVNVQVIERVEGIVAQNVNGLVTEGTPVAELIEIVRQFGGDAAEDLEFKARELADSGAPHRARLRARQALKTLLSRNVARIEQSAHTGAWNWVVGSVSDWLG